MVIGCVRVLFIKVTRRRRRRKRRRRRRRRRRKRRRRRRDESVKYSNINSKLH